MYFGRKWNEMSTGGSLERGLSKGGAAGGVREDPGGKSCFDGRIHVKAFCDFFQKKRRSCGLLRICPGELECVRLRHLRRAAAESFPDPVGMRETTSGKNFDFLLHIVFHAPDGGLGVVQQEVGGPTVAIVRKANAPRVGDEYFATFRTRNTPNK